MDINGIILIVAGGGNALLAACVWRARARKLSSYLFLAMVGLILFWTVANYAIDESHTGAQALFWTRALFASALGYIYLFYAYARTFPRESFPRMDDGSLFVSVGMFSAILATIGTNLVFADAVLGPAGLNDLSFGPLYLPLSLFGLAVVAAGIGTLAVTARRAGRTIIRDQAILIILGWVMFLGMVIIVAAILPYFIPSLISGSKIAPLFSIIMVGFSAYAIARHQFLDITPYMRRGLVYSLLLGTILGAYVAILFMLMFVFRTSSDVLEFLAGVTTIITGIFTAPHIERYFSKLTDRFFFKDRYDYAAAIEELSYILNTTVRIPQLVQRSIRALERILKPARIEFLYSNTGTRYDMNGTCEGPGSPAPKESVLILPICSDEQKLGELLLWPKRSGDPYTKEDISLVRTFASQAVVALQKAELYEQLKEYSGQLEEKVRDRTQHLEDLRTSQREFMDDISHALQTPLTVLTSTMELVMKELGPAEKRHAKLASQSIGELSRLIRALLALARIEAIPAEEALAIVNLSDAIERLCEYVQVVCVSKDIELTYDIQPGLSVMGNQVQLEEAITNILSNAVRYTEECAVRSIRVGAALVGEAVEISVSDSGIGIGADHLSYIFERFYRAQETQGSGMGLAITKRVIERHGGTIRAESAYGSGTLMVIALPIPVAVS